MVESDVGAGERVVLRWRDRRGGRTGAWDRIGPWPGGALADAKVSARANSPAGAGSPAYRHAAQAWHAARQTVTRAASEGTAGAMYDLAMVSALARHMAGCERCRQTSPLDSATPMQWLTWAIRQRPRMWRVYAPILADLGGSERGLRRAPR